MLMLLLCCVWFAQVNSLVVFTMKPEEEQRVLKSKDKSLKVFCVDKSNKQLGFIFISKTLNVNINSDDYAVYRGNSSPDVVQQSEGAKKQWVNLMPFRANNISLEAFKDSCVGIETFHSYSVHYKLIYIDIIYLLMTLCGVFFFWSAKRLARNVIFYYGTGVSIGVLASLLVIIFILSRFIPKKSGMYAVIIGGWSMVLASMHYLWEHLETVLHTYKEYVLGYFIVASLISFALCYWWGPVQNPRTLNLIQWTIQLFSLILIYFGIQIFEVRLAVITIMMFSYLLRRVFFFRMPKRVRYWWWRFFPPKTKLLTESEYMAQASRETRHALDELRDYCQSPDCNAWKTISRLQSPSRFACFVEGDSHLTDEELIDHDSYNPYLPSDYDISEDEIDLRLNT